MYLFTRSARLGTGKTREGIAWALGMTEKVNQITELDVSLWIPVFSPGIGTLTWSAMVEDLAVLEAADAKLAVDDAFVAESDRGAAFGDGQGIEDTLAQLVYGSPDASRRPTYAAVVRSALTAGSFASGLEVGVEIAQRVEKLTGIPTMFLLSTTGAYGGVSWITGYESVQELEKAEAAVNGDADFVKLIDKKAATAFESSASTQTLHRRIA